MYIKNFKRLFRVDSSASSEFKQKVYFIGLQGVLALFFITPFAILRFVNHEFTKFTLDIVIVLGMMFLSAYVVYGKGKRFINQLTYLFAAIYILGASATLHFGDIYSVMWAYPAAISCYFVLNSKYAIYYTALLFLALLTIGVVRLSSLELAIILASYIATCALSFILSTQIMHDRKMIENYSFYDVLTGAKTRNILISDLQTAINEHNSKPNTHLSVIIFDIDYFKKINDSKGHSIGDHVLKQVTKVVNQQLSIEQNIYRYGGEEFFILLKLDADSAFQLAERIRAAIQDFTPVAELKVTISLGVAEHKLNEKLESVTKRADEALYCSKKEGRNRATLAT